MVESTDKTDKEPIKSHHIKVDTQAFIHENTGNIKDFYKISSCIGRGKYNFDHLHTCGLLILSVI